MLSTPMLPVFQPFRKTAKLYLNIFWNFVLSSIKYQLWGSKTSFFYNIISYFMWTSKTNTSQDKIFIILRIINLVTAIFLYLQSRFSSEALFDMWLLLNLHRILNPLIISVNDKVKWKSTLLEKSIQKIKTIPFILRAQGLTFLLYS